MATDEVPFEPIKPGDSPIVQNREFSFTTKTLERERFYQRFIVPESQLGAFSRNTFEVSEDYAIDFGQMRLIFEMEVLKEPLGSEEIVRTGEVQVPATWWQHYKESMSNDILARWIRRRWPVKYKIERRVFKFQIDHAAIYPEANIAVPALGRAIPYHQIKEIT